MSNESKETIADIVRMIRKSQNGNVHTISPKEAYALADRIEAAAKREREAGAETAQICGEIGEMVGREATCKESVTNCNQLGNAAAMREALETINRIDTRRLKRLLCELVEADILDGGEINKTISAVEKARQALSAPPRNCDVGTAEEQYERWRSNCGHGIPECFSGCKVYKRASELGLSNRSIKRSCKFVWAQMPYEEGGAE